MQRYQQNYFSLIFLFTDVKTYNVFFIIIYTNMIFLLFFKRLDHMYINKNLFLSFFFKMGIFFIFLRFKKKHVYLIPYQYLTK
jgi:hypothetical protein